MSAERDIRIYYHKELAPASDIDLFIYGLDEEGAVGKIREIEACIQSNSLERTTVRSTPISVLILVTNFRETIRTKNAISIISRFPIRHVQIILRLYQSVSEVLTGFDVDSSCVVFDGLQVWTTPRGLAAFATQVNNIDLSRRSPSYEMRLAKYRRWGFEIYWSGLDRSRVNPRILYEQIEDIYGLARLLTLERLFKGDIPMVQAAVKWPHLELLGNTTIAQESDYQAFRIPYGPQFDASKVWIAQPWYIGGADCDF